jgi:hypothetical protein
MSRKPSFSLVFCTLLSLLAPIVARAETVDEVEAKILDLYDSGKLFKRASYKDVRAAFASLFIAQHETDIKAAYGDDYEALTAYLDAHVELKETFYTAIDPKSDDVRKALLLFKEIWKEFPDKLDKWGNLAIAVAVVWDKPRIDVYDYTQHQRRTKSLLPEGQLGAIENFRYIVDNEKKLVQPTHFYPWEFLTFVIDHRTPLPEREWAFAYYKAAKGKVASWHQDVPYDKDMLKGEQTHNASLLPKIAGKEYTLANIRKYGGVCANQADFAARVAKSVGAPAAWCWGESAHRGLHAWWMHVHIASATKDEIKFTLLSDGRYQGFEQDKFYIGHVTDPQTGKDMLDRDLERRLWIVGSDRLGKRLCAYLAEAYPIVLEKRGLEVKQKLAYIDKTMKVNKYDDFAWLLLADMAAKDEFSADQKKTALDYVKSLALTFANYPDFIGRVFDPMLEAVPTTSEKAKLYDQVMALYEKAKRPDLVCSARLRVTELMLADEKEKVETAGKGILITVRKFPTEGRYVPKLMSKMDEIAPKYKTGVQQTAQLYLDLLPKMIIHYRDPNDEFCAAIEKQAKSFLTANDQKTALSQLEARVKIATTAIGKR